MLSTRNLELNSFSSYDDAISMCKLLQVETGNEYIIATDSDFGFKPIRKTENNFINHNNQVSNDEYKNTIYHQSLKGFIIQYFEIAIGILLLLNPYIVLRSIFSLIDITTVPEWCNLSLYGSVSQAIGYSFLLYGSIFIIYNYLSIKLYFEIDGVILKKGIIAQEQVHIRYEDIKTVGVQQSIADRILGIGTVRLDSAGTNGTVDIIFKNIINPIKTRLKI